MNKNQKPRNRKPRNQKPWKDKTDQKEGKSLCPVDTDSKDNDPDWYGGGTTMLHAAASFPYARPTGIPIFSNPAAQYSPSSNIKDITIPGVLTLHWAPTIGGATSPIDAVNVAANSLYAYVRHANSGHSNYDAPDLMNYILAIDSAISYYCHMVRLYGLLNNYSMENRYTPIALVKGAYGDFDNLQANMANFRSYIAQYAYRIGSLAIPKDIKYITRHIWMNENVYKDAETDKAQYYMYVQSYYLQWSEGTSDTNLGKLKLVAPITHADDSIEGRTSYVANLNEIIQFGNSLLDPIIGSEDMNIMSGDILKAFGAGNLFTVLPIAETYFVRPTYSQEVLSQIENSVTCPSFHQFQVDTTFGSIWLSGNAIKIANLTGSTIDQDATINEGALVENYKFNSPEGLIAALDMTKFPNLSYEAFVHSNNELINMHKVDITPEDTAVATRLLLGPSALLKSNALVYPKCAYGSEVVTAYGLMCYINTDSEGYDDGRLALAKIYFANDMYYQDGVDGVASRNMDQLISIVSNFDWHPRLRAIRLHTTAPGTVASRITTTQPIIDIENIAVVSYENLRQLNEVALLNEFTCRSMGEFTPTNK